jgi:uncharacterized protein (TIGR03083 family)
VHVRDGVESMRQRPGRLWVSLPGMAGMDLVELYQTGRERFVGLVRGLGADELAAPVPACPKWTVRDVLAHQVGVARDVQTRNMDGAPGEQWTAAHIDRTRHDPLEALIEQWDASEPAVLAFLREHPQSRASVLDLTTHEQDIRGALGRPGGRDSAVILSMTPGLLKSIDAPAPLLIRTQDGDVRVGPEGDAPAVLTTDRFEAFRWRFGRRSRAQVARLDWGGADPERFLDALFIFGPTAVDIVE